MNLDQAEARVIGTLDTVARGMSMADYAELLDLLLDNLAARKEAVEEEAP